eukprot:7347940-Lingulodinium_polyedra.AAC.1
MPRLVAHHSCASCMSNSLSSGALNKSRISDAPSVWFVEGNRTVRDREGRRGREKRSRGEEGGNGSGDRAERDG